MTWLRLLSVITVAILLSLLLARVHPFGNAGLSEPEDDKPAIPERAAMPGDVRGLLTAKCADCHSTRIHVPVYGHFAPISWLLERDVINGRKHLNFSQWDNYAQDQQQTLEAKILRETKTDVMPLAQYRVIHWSSKITPADLRILARWASDSRPSSTGAGAGTLGDSERGKAIFERRCTGCHAMTENREGPKLQGVYGRMTGSIAGFPYSSALKKANVTWNDQSLEKWLTDPDVFLPGNNMDFSVSRPQERLDLIAFFKKSAGR